MPELATPWFLLLLPAIAAAWAWRARGGRRRAAVRFSSTALADDLPVSLRQRLRHAPIVLRLLALALTAVALARPVTGEGETRTRADGVAVMTVIDRSWSMSEPMRYRGEEMSRIEVVKRVLTDFVRGDDAGDALDGRSADLIGLVSFARFAETVCPLSRVHDALVDLVDGIRLAPRQSMEAGTAIGDGLALAAARLRTAEEELAERNEGIADPEFEIRSKVIILLTDGSENVGQRSAAEAASLCAEWGIKIYAIGIGDPDDGPAGNMRLERRLLGYGFREDVLRDLAQRTGGAYWAATDGDTLRDIYAEIDRLETSEIESVEYVSWTEAYAPWLAAAIGLLVLETLLSTTWLRRIA